MAFRNQILSALWADFLNIVKDSTPGSPGITIDPKNSFVNGPYIAFRSSARGAQGDWQSWITQWVAGPDTGKRIEIGTNVPRTLPEQESVYLTLDGNGGVVKVNHFHKLADGTDVSYSIPIEDTGWIPVTAFQNGWVNFDARTAVYRRINGIVYLQGIVKNGVVGGATAIFTLPAGFRPRANVLADTNFPITSNGAFGIVAVDGTSGNVIAQAGSSAYMDLCSISFPADH